MVVTSEVLAYGRGGGPAAGIAFLIVLPLVIAGVIYKVRKASRKGDDGKR